MRIVLDSGVSDCRNIGDHAILDVTQTRLQKHTLHIFDADTLFKPTKLHPFLFLKALVQCDLYYLVSGGLFKHTGYLYIYRKLVALMLARCFRKQIYIDTQTVFLRGFTRILFKLCCQGLCIHCRDHYSIQECQLLGLRATFKPDLLITHRTTQHVNRVVCDNRYPHPHPSWLIVPIIHTNLDWRIVRHLFESASHAYCASFHSAVFATNTGVKTTVYVENEYYQRKFSVLTDVSLSRE